MVDPISVSLYALGTLGAGYLFYSADQTRRETERRDSARRFERSLALEEAKTSALMDRVLAAQSSKLKKKRKKSPPKKPSRPGKKPKKKARPGKKKYRKTRDKSTLKF